MPSSAHQSERTAAEATTFAVLIALSLSHLLNDTIQSLLPAIYPLLKDSYHLSFSQIGLITFVFQVTASLLQPLVGHYTDRKPLPYSLPVGMGITLLGLALLSQAWNYPMILISSALVGMGSSIFHPEASRLARLASGGQHGFAQSIFQVGGNLGSSLGPLLAALVVMTHGQAHILWFTLLALVGIAMLTRVGHWYREHLAQLRRNPTAPPFAPRLPLSRARTVGIIAILAALIFSKYFYLASLSSYYTFYLIHKFDVTAQHSQFFLFLFLFAVAAGTIIGGPVGDRIGRKLVIWVSILGVAPFTLLLPHANLAWTAALSMIIGLILASAFSAILVYAQELVPGRVGLVSGLFFGFAFGMAGIGSALLGWLADHTSIEYVFNICGYLPLIGLLAAFLPNLDRLTRPASR
ncbi:MAG: MFS transporter [Opitutaceae bacterium]|nr:MFS transporter [Opitutaceae bacterium]MBP9911971.1 MFS transporter [Opitutaceae bacterium]